MNNVCKWYAKPCSDTKHALNTSHWLNFFVARVVRSYLCGWTWSRNSAEVERQLTRLVHVGRKCKSPQMEDGLKKAERQGRFLRRRLFCSLSKFRANHSYSWISLSARFVFGSRSDSLWDWNYARLKLHRFIHARNSRSLQFVEFRLGEGWFQD